MNIETLESLAERLDKATGPDRELDFDIATAIEPGVICLRYNEDDRKNEPFTHWEYTFSIDDACALCERIFPGCEYGVYYFGHRMPRFAKAEVAQIGGPHAEDVKGATPALALCLALIRALIEKEGTP